MKAASVCAVLLVSGASPAFAEPPSRAVAVLRPTTGHSVEGTVTFSRTAAGVRVQAHIAGLSPGRHGFHIHQFGDCRSGDGKSAGGHFNPTAQAHGAPGGAQRHTGDLGNIEAGADGVAKLDVVDARAAFEGRESILGRAVIIHAKADDLKSQPTGDAGGRVACGLIGVVKSE